MSSLVIDECSAGDPTAAIDRLATFQGVVVLADRPEADALAASLLRQVPLPAKAAADANHIALAAVHGCEFLLTWHCRHISNAVLRQRIEALCRLAGYEPPVICNPAELLGLEDGSWAMNETS